MTLISSGIDAGCVDVLLSGGCMSCVGVVFGRMHGDGTRQSNTSFSLERPYRKGSRRWRFQRGWLDAFGFDDWGAVPGRREHANQIGHATCDSGRYCRFANRSKGQHHLLLT
jgi:hypothetical protein